MNPTIQDRVVLALEGYVALEAAADGRPRAKVTLIKAGPGKNRRNYRASALEAAVKAGLYTGARMFINHSDKPPMKRSLTEMVSAVESVEWDPIGKKIDGTVVFFDKDFASKVESAREYLGASVNNLIRVTRQPQTDGTVMEDVQSIERVHSVDWVIYPAAGGELLHFLESEEDPVLDWSKITLDDLKANAPDSIKAMIKKAEEAETPEPPQPDPPKVPDPDEIKKIASAAATEAVTAYIADQEDKKKKRATVTQKVLEQLKTSGLPEPTRNRLAHSFESVDEYDQKTVTESIEAARLELKAAGAGPRITGAGPSGGGDDKTPRTGEQITVRESVEGFFIRPAKKEAVKEGAAAK